ncbi:MAG TPA: 4'-phosphopantetheinyl transferase superfamily protein [Ferruginibacter sp.]|nr:4'-phosphopantetheinyl transferase superfamily protein [Ferruginibacter sp.]
MSPTITNQNLANISWAIATGFDRMNGEKADFFRIRISDQLSFLADRLSVLSSEEIARANRFHQTKDKNRYIIAHGMLRNILEKKYLHQPAAAIKFIEGKNKKPYLDADKKLFFNISYSGDWIVLAIAGSEIGVDIEMINRDLDINEVMQQSFSEDEINYMNTNSSREQFFLLWTRKEAILKATGQGLNNHLKLIPVVDGTHSVPNIISSNNDWQVSSFAIADNYIASIAINYLVNEIRFWDIE